MSIEECGCLIVWVFDVGLGGGLCLREGGGGGEFFGGFSGSDLFWV